MNKWIAEFDLEDGDTMPEHMDLEYKGAKIDFYCKPLDQEPFINKPCVSEGVCHEDKMKVLEKIKAEIEQDAFKDVNGSKYISVNRVNQIINKYTEEVMDDD